ncbi:hypothetical protein [Bosea sp. (in: a-proteobacteria)]|uniref:hypothetical protein n=1 Tax=Bosea sp. (in: a-proteobacteria) TaxID=1871050 RepID=UPI001220AE2C|nr:hypothetical protein [Bosea sp. (in: a-proteobacteria)]TAJ34655.1 MAG: hypothetical protein EPO59_01115 [Bosea sp. (in: a-proteobacteria)]
MAVEARHAAGRLVEIDRRKIVGRNLFIERLRFSGLFNILVVFGEGCIVVAHLRYPKSSPQFPLVDRNGGVAGEWRTPINAVKKDHIAELSHA